ncbi:MAG: 6-phosphogluconolactonase [Terriglobales bacterium]
MVEWVTRAGLGELTEEFCRRLAEVTVAAGAIPVALTGGRSAGIFYDAWVAQGVNARMEFYWSDERLVPDNDTDSNVKLGRERLLLPGKVGEEGIHAPRTALAGTACAADYAASIRLAVPPGKTGIPSFPLIILGMGADGHTGSLFPGRNPFEEQEKLVRAVEAAQAHPHARITFTPELINAAQRVWFVITGAAKAWAVEQLVRRTATPEQIPALAVDPGAVGITIFADEGSTGGQDYGVIGT